MASSDKVTAANNYNNYLKQYNEYVDIRNKLCEQGNNVKAAGDAATDAIKKINIAQDYVSKYSSFPGVNLKPQATIASSEYSTYLNELATKIANAIDKTESNMDYAKKCMYSWLKIYYSC